LLRLAVERNRHTQRDHHHRLCHPTHTRTQVSSDLVLLAQQIGALTANSSSDSRTLAAAASYCRLLHAVLRAQQQLQLPPQAANAICGCLRLWLDAPSAGPAAAAPRAPLPGSAPQSGPGERLQLEALAALAELLPHHLQRVGAAERAALLAALGSLLPALGSTGGASTSSSGGAGGCSSPSPAALEAQRQAAAILGSLCRSETAVGGSNGSSSSSSSSSGSSGGGAAGKLTEAEVADTLRNLAAALTACCGGLSGSSSSGGGAGGGGGGGGGGARRPVEDVRHARMYAQLLRSCTAAVSVSRKGWGQHAGAICEALRRLMQYGATATADGAGGSAAAVKTDTRAECVAAAASQTGGDAVAAAAAAVAGPASAPGSPSNNSSKAAGVRYVPPHLRLSGNSSSGGIADSSGGSPLHSNKQQQQQQQQQQPPLWDESDASASDSGDTSDGESRASALSSRSSRSQRTAPALDTANAFATAASRVRIAALLLLQAMAQADPPALHPHWSSILPAATASPLATRPLSPHLLTVLLHDPSPRVRAVAAATLVSLLQGPQPRALLAVAQFKDRAAGMHGRAAVRGFTTLSATLGQIVVALHLGLTAAAAPTSSSSAATEPPPPPMVIGALRALCALCSATPYERMPSNLLPLVVEAALSAWQASDCSWNSSGSVGSSSSSSGSKESGGAPLAVPIRLIMPISSGGDDASSIAVAAVACIAQALSTKQPAPALGQLLAAAAAGRQPAGSNSPPPQQQQPSLWAVLSSAAQSPLPLLRIEALAALRGMCANYPPALPAASTPLPTAGPTNTPAVPRNGSCGTASSSSTAWAALLQAARIGLVAADEAALVSPQRAAGWQPPPSSSSPRRGGGTAAAAPNPAGDAPESGAVAGSGSPEDKAAQHAVRLLGSYLAAAQPPQEEAALLWAEAADLLLPQLEAPCSSTVRASVLAAVAEIDGNAWSSLPPSRRTALLAALGRAATADPAPTVRIAACKALGALVLLFTFNGHQCEDDAAALLRPLAAATSDGAAGVRQAAAWAVANASDALRSSQEQQQEQQPPLAQLPLPEQQLALLCNAALSGANDVDKARANGVRALGNLLAAWRPAWGAPAAGGPGPDNAAPVQRAAWLSQSLGALQSCLATGGMKTQWNACCAATGLLHNTQLVAGSPEVTARLPALLLALLMLVRDSANFKIRTHAAAALQAPRQRSIYGDSYTDAVLIVLAALDGVESGSSAGGGGGAAAATATGSAPADASQSKAAAAAAKSAATAAAAEEVAADGGTSGSFPNFRYLPGLAAQLRATLLHLIQFADDATSNGRDGARLRDQLQRRRGVLMHAVAAAAAALHVGVGGGVADGAGGGGDGGSGDFPVDPFGQQQQGEGGVGVGIGICSGDGNGAAPAARGAKSSRDALPVATKVGAGDGATTTAAAAAAAAQPTGVQKGAAGSSGGGGGADPLKGNGDALVARASAALDALLPGFSQGLAELSI